jgi:hypothetical protein
VQVISFSSLSLSLNVLYDEIAVTRYSYHCICTELVYCGQYTNHDVHIIDPHETRTDLILEA